MTAESSRMRAITAINGKPNLIQAVLPTYKGLIEAVRKDSERLRTCC